MTLTEGEVSPEGSNALAVVRRSRHFWIVRRLLMAVATLFVISLIVFVATQALPGDAAKAILGKEATPERLAQLREELGLDRPLPEQYLSWLGGVLHGDLGTSLAQRVPVSSLIGDRIMNTGTLVALSIIAILPLSLVIGSIGAVRRDSLFDHATSTVFLVLNSLPEFVVALALVILLGTTVFTVFPPVALFPPGESPTAHLDALVLPVATLVLVSVPYLARLVRASMIDVMESDYVQMARLKGLTERRILTAHALPNALLPTIQGTALILAYLAGGIVVVEYVFRYPGLGGALTEAVNARDLPMIQAVTLILAAMYVIVNLAADILSVLVTPKLRTRSR
jgi:peptide/nickel transport system permease protein